MNKRIIIAGLCKSFRDQKDLAEQAFNQVDAAGLQWIPPSAGNSIAILVRHISGHLTSRFTDFYHSDGERPDRNKKWELSNTPSSISDLQDTWNKAWDIVFSTFNDLTDDDLEKNKNLRGQPMSFAEYLPRVLAHTAYHTGQIVLLAKQYLGDKWQHLV